MSANQNARNLGGGLYINIETGALTLNAVPLRMRRQLARVLRVLYEKWCEDITKYTKPLVIRDGAWPPDTKRTTPDESDVHTAVTALRRLFERYSLEELLWIDSVSRAE